MSTATRRKPPPAPRPRRPGTLHVGDVDLQVSNLDKVMYPETGFTKGNVIQYYIDVAGALLPHLEERALTMKRYPDGVGKFFFYEKSCPPYRPKWLRTARIPSTTKGETRHCVIDSLPGLVWVANLADLELHVSLARASVPHRPTVMVFDLDPGEGSTLLDCAEVALLVRTQLTRHGLKSFPKTSGSKGLQVYVPLNTTTTFDHTGAFAKELARTLEAARPDKIVSNMRKELRRKKVLIDWSQNDDHKTTVCVYSLRATPEPGVSTPVEWKEVTAALRQRNPKLLRFGPKDVLARIRRRGDLFAPVLTLKQKLGAKRAFAPRAAP